jgi:hypothetical protein
MGSTKIGFAGACVGVGPSIKGDLDFRENPGVGRAQQYVPLTKPN